MCLFQQDNIKYDAGKIVKPKIKKLCLMFFVFLFSISTFSGCALNYIEWNIMEGFDEEEYIPPDYNFEITAEKTKINIDISNVGVLGESATVVALKPNQYLYGENYTGLSDEVAAMPIEIANYECGTSKKLAINRYFSEANFADGVYYKFYILNSSDEILAGPKFCTSFDSVYGNTVTLAAPKSKKGVSSEDVYTTEVAKIGASYTAINLLMDYMFAPNEFYNMDTGLVEPIIYTEGKNEQGELTISNGTETWTAESYDYNGKRYYFRLDLGGPVSLRSRDKILKAYTDAGIRVTVIMLLNNVYDRNNKYIQPYHITYPATMGSNGYVQFNTSNSIGADYWAAFMEFLGKRYSQPNSKYGNVFSYVLGNEIDAPTQWNQIVAPNQPTLQLEDYLEEYERQMRIANTALKKYHDNSKVLISLTNRWTLAYNEYAPKQILDYITRKTLNEGNYDYGLASHPYGANLGVPNFWSNDLTYSSMNGSLNTSRITWSNLEVLQLYLEQQSKRCNGKIRSVYLTEGGVSSTGQGNSMFEESINQQAAGVAYLYLKCAHLSCIETIMYYRLVDNPQENIYVGLYTSDYIKKPAYNVLKYIDTNYWYDVSFPYLKYITWSVSLGPGLPPYTYGYDVGNISSYKDTMALYSSKFNWQEVWNEDNIVKRIINEQDFII